MMYRPEIGWMCHGMHAIRAINTFLEYISSFSLSREREINAVNRVHRVTYPRGQKRYLFNRMPQ